jgi:hypothetical protein
VEGRHGGGRPGAATPTIRLGERPSSILAGPRHFDIASCTRPAMSDLPVAAIHVVVMFLKSAEAASER